MKVDIYRESNDKLLESNVDIHSYFSEDDSVGVWEVTDDLDSLGYWTGSLYIDGELYNVTVVPHGSPLPA